MAVLIDPPRWPAHGRLWSHLVSDSDLAELHELAARTGIPRRAFEGDHYDVPAERHAALVAAGAQPVEARELLARLVASGLRVPKRRGERVLSSEVAADGTRIDVVRSGLVAPAETGSLLDRDAGDVLVVHLDGRWVLPPQGWAAGTVRTVGFVRRRPPAGGASTWTVHRVLRGAAAVPAGVAQRRVQADDAAALLAPDPVTHLLDG